MYVQTMRERMGIINFRIPFVSMFYAVTQA